MFLEQKGDLCTVRLLPDGKPYRDNNNCVSIVPAGHGVLTRLFPHIKAQVKAHSAFIRNIDNVMGGAEQTVEVCRSFLRLHHFIITHVQKIRSALQRKKLDRAEQLAHDIIISVLRRKPPANALWFVLKELFHSERPAADAETDRQNLRALYARPVNTLGQVPNNGKDMGGTPVFAKWNGHRIKVCLEIPHMRGGRCSKHCPQPRASHALQPCLRSLRVEHTLRYTHQPVLVSGAQNLCRTESHVSRDTVLGSDWQQLTLQHALRRSTTLYLQPTQVHHRCQRSPQR